LTARTTASLLALALTLGAGRARADDADTKAIGGTDGANLIAGTPRYRVAVDAARTNAKVFGAIGAFERQILPAFSRPYSGDVLGGEISVVKNVVQGIGTCGTADQLTSCPNGLARHHVTVSAGNLAIGYRLNRYLGVFLTSSWVAAYSSPSNLDARDGIAPLYPVMGWAFGPLSLFGKKVYYNLAGKVLDGTGADAVVGASVRTPYVNGFAGYTASQGLFADFTISDIDTFASAVLGDSFEQLSYLKAGLREFDYLNNSDLARKIGRLNLFGRRLVYNVPTAAGDPRPGLSAPITSAHVEQVQIGGWLDLMVAMRVQPQKELAELRAGLRTGDFTLSGGVVNLPNLWMFGAEGGYRPTFALRYHAQNDDQSGDYLGFDASVVMNDPELLTVFPYAYNAVSLKMSFAMRGAEKDSK
jgi:hypothetical protein